jgi:hypothetical protein
METEPEYFYTEKEVRELLRDPKKKSLTLLGIYFIFFIFVYVVLNASSTSTPTPVIEEEEKEVLSTLENYKLMESYNYKITYTGLNKIDIIDGIYYKGNSLFSYNNMKYYLEDFNGNRYPIINNNCLTHIMHYKNINWMMYSSKRKHLVIDCQYTYSSEKKCDELYPQNIPSVPMVSDVMQKGTVVVPMCFGAVESILTVFLRTTGISINRDDHEWHK